jgi:hypothetical protein
MNLFNFKKFANIPLNNIIIPEVSWPDLRGYEQLIPIKAPYRITNQWFRTVNLGCVYEINATLETNPKCLKLPPVARLTPNLERTIQAGS